MQRRIRYRMELYVLTDYFVFFAVNDNFNVSVIKTERIQSFGQFNRIQADEFGLFVATIDNGRNAALTTTCTSCPPFFFIIYMS